MVVRLRDLGYRYWVLFGASGISSLAAGIGLVAMPLLAAALTRDPFLIATLATFSFLPWPLLALVSGAIIDRIDRRKVMVAANLARVVILAGLLAAVLAEQATIWLLYLAAFLLGTTEPLYDGAARSILPTVVRRDQLDTANGPLNATETVSRSFLGAPIGGFLFAIAAAAPFLSNSLGFLGAAALLLFLPGSYRAARTGPPAGLLAEMVHGVRWLWAHRLLRGVAVLNSLATLGLFAVTALLVLFVIDVLGVPEAFYGLFVLTLGAGGVVGALLAPRLLRRWSRTSLLTAGAVAPGIAFTVAGLVPQPLVVAPLFFVGGGLGMMSINVLTMSLNQALIPPELFGRVQGARRTLTFGLAPVGTFLGGLFAQAFGVRALYVAAGLLQLVLAVPLWRLLRRHRRAVDSLEPEPASDPPVGDRSSAEPEPVRRQLPVDGGGGDPQQSLP